MMLDQLRRLDGSIKLSAPPIKPADGVLLSEKHHAVAGRAKSFPVYRRLYITIGMVCFVVILPLAVTSNNLAIRRLGGMAWQRLHRFVYLAAILAALHFLMSVKSWPIEPIIYALIVAILLGYRLARSLMRGQIQGKLKGMS
jgi:DMSO/TMAO reductase YedYZ heme-binding membrane subunit